MKTTLKLQNIKCGGCTNGIAVRLLKLSGINNVQVSDETSEVSFSYETVNDLAIAERMLTQMGYPPEGVDNTVVNKAKSLISCATGKLNIA
ncbi:copper chaperone [Galbibacter orientalis DSM 19592]|mgnify:CR=1 FL=1|uniref:Copper chaperone n=1 Tax=Galbibacter orientalis DSM 19592 TaxID=926559 RepID=I3C1X3_9FLAO|nr:heavy-metal-associated domain-containing protein [Galbibacter orientalis]EIJ37616.1 copper chaperone [Galbibacter orientalis DSM 19592]